MSETRTEPTTRAVEATIEIDAPPEMIWQALTDARELERWFPLEARVEPGEGGTVFMSWKNEYQAESRITVWEPGRTRVMWRIGTPSYASGPSRAWESPTSGT